MKTGQIFQFGEYCVDPLTRTLRRNDVPLALQRRAFDVLFYLVQNPGRIVPKDELLKNVWPDTFVDENNLAQSISSLRKALGQLPNEPNYIATLPGRGYQFIAPVQVVAQETRLAAAESTAPATAANGFLLQQRTMTTSIVTEEVQPRSRARRRALAAALAVTGLLAAGYAWWRHVHMEPTTATVVLADFVNTTGDAAFDYTLRRALEVDLEQSPYMDVLSEKNGVSTLLLMGRRSDTRLTPDVAREICERTNRRVLIEGTISSVGPRYLLTLVATDCGTGKTLTSAKAEAADQGRVLTALDTVAARIRSRLGESAKSLASYQVPLKEATTPSLEALKAYSTGKYLQSQGRPRVESIAAFQRAVELDPNFAMAYRELGIENRNLSQYAFSRQYFQRAIDLSGHLSNYEQLLIRADYYAYGQNNLIEGIRAFQVMASAYPHDPGPVSAIMDASDILGQYDLSIATGERGLKLFPDSALILENLGESYMRVGRFEDCKAIMQKIAEMVKGPDTGQPLGLFYIASAKHDEAEIARLSQWFDAHEDGATVWYFPSFRGEAAAATGKYRQSLPLFENAYRSALRANLPETADKVLIDEASAQLELGLPVEAAATLRRIHEPAESRPELVSLHAALGDTSMAESFLAAHSAPTPDTLMTYVYLPRVRAAVALARGKPLEAIAALDPARPYEMRDYTVPTLRGEAYLKLRLAGPAIAEYRKILDNPGIDPVSVLYPLAHLGMARAYAMQNDKAGSRLEYEALFAYWKDADAGLPILQQAHLEFERLASGARPLRPVGETNWVMVPAGGEQRLCGERRKPDLADKSGFNQSSKLHFTTRLDNVAEDGGFEPPIELLIL